MTIQRSLLCAAVALSAGCTTFKSNEWVTVDEGFHFSLPREWKKEAVGIDSHSATYRGSTGYLTFDDAWGSMYLQETSREEIAGLHRKQADPTLLRAGEEIWQVGGQIADFRVKPNDSNNPSDLPYGLVARLEVPYAQEPGHLTVEVAVARTADLELARKILGSLTWPLPGNRKK